MNLAEMYYHQVYGYYPFRTEAPLIRTRKVIDHLKDAGITDTEILQVIEEAPRADYLTPDMLPEWLWESELTEKGVFYFHRILHIKPNGPRLDTKTEKAAKVPFFLEMKIRFSMQDLIDYYYRKAETEEELKYYKKEEGAFKNLLSRYKKISFVEPLDFVLSLVDYKAQDPDAFITSPFDITTEEKQVYRDLKTRAQQASLIGADQIIWR